MEKENDKDDGMSPIITESWLLEEVRYIYISFNNCNNIRFNSKKIEVMHLL